MLPLLSAIISAYVITRMVETIVNKETHGFVAICAFCTILVSLLCMALILHSSLDVSSLSSQIPH
jgi:uncharacterized membrane protein